MSDFSVDTVVIGAGVVGLAIANELSKQNREVLVVEAEEDFGQITSSRNSGVIHAGIYYPENSNKSKFCVLGNRLLYDYCKKYYVPYLNTKKILVASSLDQITVIDQIKNQAEKNGVKDIKKISKTEQTTDWGLKKLTLSQQKYAATDVLYLHKLKNELDKMLIRENRVKLAQACFDFIKIRTDLDLSGWSELDIFKH